MLSSVSGVNAAAGKVPITGLPSFLSGAKRNNSECEYDCQNCGIEREEAPSRRNESLAQFTVKDDFPPPPSFLPGSWSIEQERHHLLPKVQDILDFKNIAEALEKTKEAGKDKKRVKEILKKAWDHAILKDAGDLKSEFIQGLTVEEAATLLNVPDDNKDVLNELFSMALKVKERIYGNRVVLFAPLYLSNYCQCTCLYCGYRAGNEESSRRSLSNDEIADEVARLEQSGHRRLLLLTGEHPKYTFEQFLEALHITDSVRTEPHGKIRRINVEIPPLSISDVRRVKATGVVGTSTLFQESYHIPTYKRMHPSGPKAHYQHRLQTMDRNQIGGIDDCGIGALFGLYDYRFEVLAMLQHAQHLDRVYGAGPHTISIPRLRPAQNAPASDTGPYMVNDMQFRKLVAVLRLAVPYTGMILSTRESVETRRAVCRLGVSQMSAGSRTSVGAYSKGEEKKEKEEGGIGHGQFTLSDGRDLDTVIHHLMEDGFAPSFCTACYRTGRTGRTFMNIAKRGDIANLCGPNASLTLAEYLADYASPETKKLGLKVLAKERKKLSKGARKVLDKNLKKILEQDERDIYV